MISIIIPTFNEAGIIEKLVHYLANSAGKNSVEIIVCDGGSADGTLEAASNAGAIAILSPQKGRAQQMNFGASLARGNILYFVHADTVPAETFASDIEHAVNEGYGCGRYRTRFDSSKWMLKINAFFTRFDWFVCYGGDQTFFITRDGFNKIGGFNGKMSIMEDFDIVPRARKNMKYKIFRKAALVSARKYDNNSWIKVQKANATIVRMYRKGALQQEMVTKYKEMLIL